MSTPVVVCCAARRLDALDDFRRSLKDTHDQCRSLLESAERNGERLEPAERNVLLGAVQGLVGVLTFMGGANEQRFTKLCELALDKLKALNDHINRCVAFMFPPPVRRWPSLLS